MRFFYTKQLNFLQNHFISYPSPVNINYLWNFGFLAGLCLMIQIISGITLVMHYTPHMTTAFASIEHIMRDVNWGWLLRYTHSNGASFFFIVLYMHMGKALYFRSYLAPRIHLWLSGLLIFLLLMATGFLGYVLPWGQMSFWGATVITNLFSAIPLIGPHMTYWLWGGFSVDNATLQRFFSLHYLLPFVISGLTMIHLLLLHENGSTTPLGTNAKYFSIPFFPYFWTKDWFGFFTLTSVLLFVICFYPNKLGHPDNYIFANSLVTPTHIVPEWYFLPFYAILRSIPNKLAGVICMFFAILILAFLPWMDRSVCVGSQFKPLFIHLYWTFIGIFLFLGWLGAQVVEEPYIQISQFMTISYFLFFFLIWGFGKIESLLINMKKSF